MENIKFDTPTPTKFLNYILSNQSVVLPKLSDCLYLNHDSIFHKPNSNDILILDLKTFQNEIQINLLLINLDYNRDISVQNPDKGLAYYQYLKDKYFDIIEIEFYDKNDKITQFSANDPNEIPKQFSLNKIGTSILFYSASRVFGNQTLFILFI